MEEQLTDYIQGIIYERSENRTSQLNGYYDSKLTTRVGTKELKVPRTLDGEYSPTVYVEGYLRIENSLLASMLEMYVFGVSKRKVYLNVEELYGNLVT